MIAYDLSNHEIKIATRLNSHYEYDVKVKAVQKSFGEGGSNTEYQLVSGHAVEIFQCLQFILNFTYVINPNIDIYDLGNSSKHNVDLYLASYSLYHDRALHATPTFVVGRSKVVAFVNHDFEYISTDILTRTFGSTLLYIFLLLFAACLLTLVICAKYEQIPVLESTFHCVAIFLHQGGYVKVSKTSCQLVVLLISFAMLVTSASFSGTIISMIASNEHLITSVESLLGSEYRIFMELGRPNSTIRLMLDVAHRQHSHNFISDYIKDVQHTPSAYIIDEDTGITAINDLIGDMPCTWGKISVLGLEYPWSMFLKRNSSYRPAINYGILRLKETGTLQNINKRWIPKSSSCQGRTQPSFKSIHLSQVYTAFIWPTGGMIASVIILCLEKYFSSTGSNNN